MFFRFYISAVERAGFSSLADGAKVSFDVVPNKGKESGGKFRYSITAQPNLKAATAFKPGSGSLSSKMIVNHAAINAGFDFRERP